MAGLGDAFAGAGFAAGLGDFVAFGASAASVFALAGAGLAAGALAFSGEAFAFAGAATGAGFASAAVFADLLSSAMTKPFRFRPLFAVAANMPIPAPNFKLFLCGAQKIFDPSS